jgi:NADPH:quinone reductase-like Zn-dependent oxidoreductase
VEGPSNVITAVRLHPDGLAIDELERPEAGDGEALVRVRAAGLTRDELTWPTERLPAIASYELSGVVEEGAGGISPGDEVFALTSFERDGVAAELAPVAADLLAPKPTGLSHVEAAALPLAGLSAWQALFVHGGLETGQRVLITGATGGVGHLAVQLARWRGAHVVASTSNAAGALELGADAILADDDEPFDVAFDTAGGAALADAAGRVREGGRLVSVAEEPRDVPSGVDATYFIVEPNREQLGEIGRLAAAGDLRPMIDSVFELRDAVAGFARLEERGKHGKVVLRVGEEG